MRGPGVAPPKTLHLRGAAPSLALPRWGREPGSSPQGGDWGNLVSPYVHLRRSCGCAAQHRNENNYSWEGFALPNPPAGRLCSPQSQAHLAHSFIRFPFVGPFPPRVPGSPFQSRCNPLKGCALPNPPRGRVGSWEGCALPNPPGGEGLPPRQAGGWGNPVSPYFHLRSYC